MSAPLTPAELLLVLYTALQPWCADRGGRVSLAGDPAYILEALLDTPTGFRVVLNWGGRRRPTGQPAAGICDQTFEAWLIKAKASSSSPAISWSNGPAPFLGLLSDLRAFLRSTQFPSGVTNEQVLYTGCKQFEPELAITLPTTGYKLTFTLTAAIPYVGQSDSKAPTI